MPNASENVVKRHLVGNYLGANAVGSAEQTYNLMGLGFTEINGETGVETKEKQYVHQKAKTTRVSSYSASWGFTADHIPSQTPVKQLYEVGRNQLTGDDACFDYIVVDLWDDPTDSSYPARKFRVSAEVTEYSPDDSEMQVKGTLHQQGDFVEGTFNISNNTFTAAS